MGLGGGFLHSEQVLPISEPWPQGSEALVSLSGRHGSFQERQLGQNQTSSLDADCIRVRQELCRYSYPWRGPSQRPESWDWEHAQN